MIHMLESGSIEFNYTALETVVSGEAVASALYTQIERLDAKRVFLVASASLSERTDQFDSIKQALGGHFAGLFNQIGAHTP